MQIMNIITNEKININFEPTIESLIAYGYSSEWKAIPQELESEQYLKIVNEQIAIDEEKKEANRQQLLLEKLANLDKETLSIRPLREAIINGEISSHPSQIELFQEIETQAQELRLKL